MKRQRVSKSFRKPSRTKQSFRAQCDINTIVARARTTGLVEHVNSRPPVYGDVSSIPDYQSALHVVIQAQDAFAALDSRVRERFHNDPALLMDFVRDPKNRDEAVFLGLVPKPVPPAPPAPPVVSSTEPPTV